MKVALTTEDRKQIYKDKVKKWAAGRIFHFLSSPRIEKGQACEACRSKRVVNFQLIECNGEYFLVGWECIKLLNVIYDASERYPHWRDIDAIEKEVIAKKQGES